MFTPTQHRLQDFPVPPKLPKATRWLGLFTLVGVAAFWAVGHELLSAAHNSTGSPWIDRVLGPAHDRVSFEWLLFRAQLHGCRVLFLVWIGLAVAWLRWRPEVSVAVVVLVALAAGTAFEGTPLIRRLLVGEATSVIDAAAAPIFLLASILLGWSAWKKRGVVRSYLMIPAALAFLVLAGEEASWGQHWFGFATPAEVAAVNVQGEFNLHNLDTRFFNALFLEAALFAFLLVPCLARPKASTMPLAAFFAAFAAYFLACSHWPDGIDPVLVENLYGGLAVANAGLGLVALGLSRGSLPQRGLERLRDHFAVTERLRVAGLVAVGGWLAFGLFLGCLGALQLRPLTFLPNVDDELFEFLMAFLCVIFALDQQDFRAPEGTVGQASPSHEPLRHAA